MDAVTQEALTILCDALGTEALPVLDVARVQRWVKLPGFSCEALRQIVRKAKGRKVSSASYWEAAVSEAFTAPEPAAKPAPRLLTERAFADYLAAWATAYGRPDAGQVEWLRDRWQGERQLMGLPFKEEEDENLALGDGVSTGTALDDPLPLAA